MVARKGGDRGIDVAADCELALLGIAAPTIKQRAGAFLRALHADDVRRLFTEKD